MRVEYLPTFLKDLSKLKSISTYSAIRKLAFEEMLDYPSLQEVRNLKKLKGSDIAYRIRIGDYRVGFFFENETVTFARVLHRSKIYRSFP
ncbi:MAG: type II toxin-antitoxin system RelE/ParE family toxin [Phormidesmis sp.]